MWQDVINAAGAQEKTSRDQLKYTSLEHIHVFVLCNILRRPIIIVSDSHVHYPSGSLHESVNTYDGVYLPLLWKPEECVKSPIILGFASNHFTPLLGVDRRLCASVKDTVDALPLLRPDLTQRCVQFLSDDEEGSEELLKQQYLNILVIPNVFEDGGGAPCAMIEYNPLEDDRNLIVDQFEELTRRFHHLNLQKNETAEVKEPEVTTETSGTEREVTKPTAKEFVAKEGRERHDLKLDITRVTNEEVEFSTPPKRESRPPALCRSPSKCCNAAMYEERCWQHYPENLYKFSSPPCQNAPCTSPGTPRNGGFCRKCVVIGYNVDPEASDILARLPASERKPEEAGLILKCREENCCAASTETTLGYCSVHFVERYRAGKMKIPTQKEAREFLRDVSSYEKKAAENSASTAGAAAKKEVTRSIRCATRHCAGVRCKNDTLCLECRRQMYCGLKPAPTVIPHFYVKDTEPTKPKKKTVRPPRNPDVIESGDECEIGRPVKQCIAPQCFNVGNKDLNDLCGACYSTLLASNGEENLAKAKARVQPTLTFPEEARKCKVSGCDYAATEEQQGYCSSCFKKQKDGKDGKIATQF